MRKYLPNRCIMQISKSLLDISSKKMASITFCHESIKLLHHYNDLCALLKSSSTEKKNAAMWLLLFVFFLDLFIYLRHYDKNTFTNKRSWTSSFVKNKKREWKNKSKKFHRSWTLQNICACTQKLTFKIYDIYKEPSLLEIELL